MNFTVKRHRLEARNMKFIPRIILVPREAALIHISISVEQERALSSHTPSSQQEGWRKETQRNGKSRQLFQTEYGLSIISYKDYIAFYYLKIIFHTLSEPHKNKICGGVRRGFVISHNGLEGLGVITLHPRRQMNPAHTIFFHLHKILKK